jgi:hypothetical protein
MCKTYTTYVRPTGRIAILLVEILYLKKTIPYLVADTHYHNSLVILSDRYMGTVPSVVASRG